LKGDILDSFALENMWVLWAKNMKKMGKKHEENSAWNRPNFNPVMGLTTRINLPPSPSPVKVNF